MFDNQLHQLSLIGWKLEVGVACLIIQQEICIINRAK